MKTTILTALGGSRANGLENPDSDWDWRYIFTIPTAELLSIKGESDASKVSVDRAANTDTTTWELARFLSLATKSNPTVLEVLKGPRKEQVESARPSPSTYAGFLYDLGSELQALFPYVWSSVSVKNAFMGYATQQKRRFENNEDQRSNKYACSYLRVLYQCYCLLTFGDFPVNMRNTPVYQACRDFKDGIYYIHEVRDLCTEWEQKALDAYAHNPDKQTNLEPVNEYLLKVRCYFFEVVLTSE